VATTQIKMKNVMTIFGAVLFASVMLVSCGGDSIQSDAKKVAELQCKAQELMQKATSGDMSVVEESTKLANEAATLSKEMEGKYTSDSDKQKFSEALLKEMGNCK
jgi:hypothetical protein